MALTFNNTEVKAVTYGGKEVNKVIYSGVTVWEKIQKLATPTIAIDGDTLNITDVENAQKYKIYANGELKGEVTKAGMLNPDFATATPQELKNAVIEGQAATLYAVGATKQITLKNGQTITLRLANNTTDLYERSDGSGTTGFVLEFVECYGTKYYMNATNTNNGGWNACYMRTTVMPLILAQLPDEWQEVVATVKIKTGNGYATGNAVIESDDKLFLPAEREIFASPGDSSQAEWNTLTRWQWYAEHDTDADRVKTYNGSAVDWWERSPISGSSYYFCSVDINGYSGSNSAQSVGGVAPAFCI